MTHFQPQPAGLPSGSFGARRGARIAMPPLRRLLLAPQRLAFASGGALLVAAALWWTAVQVLPALGLPLPLLLVPDVGAAWLLALGAWPVLLAGLLCAGLPRWLGCPPLAARLLGLPLAVHAAGCVLLVAGLHGAALFASLGLALVAVGLALLAGLLGLTWLEHRHRATESALPAALAGLALLALCAWCGAVALALGQALWLQAALQAALWLGLVPMAAALLHADGQPLAPVATRLGWLQRSAWAWLGTAAGLNLVAPDAAPTAPLLLGCLSSLGMARVTTEVLAQAGRRPRIDNAVWFSALAAQLAALGATAVALGAGGPGHLAGLGGPLHLLAVQFWLAAVALWAWHLRPSLLRLPLDARA